VPTPEELKKIFKEAAEVAAEVPEPLREAAFQRALDALLPKPAVPEPPPKVSRTEPAPAPTSPSASRTGAVTTLMELMNRTELAAKMAGRKVLDRALLVLKAAHAHSVESLSATEISQVLTQKFREATTPTAVRMALDRNSEYTDRRPEGAGFVYSIMAPGERYLESLAAPSPAGHSGKLRVPERKRSRVPDTGATPKKKGRKGKTGRPGPKVMLELLLAEGFFSQPRTMGEILSHVEEKKTHRYATSDFTATLQRLTRETKLERTRNSQGQYEYKAA